ncbi:DNA polymerase eta-like [Daktulosphaira vitifoliae]|uniref:DNA polymerase eta-like n=1 Tax=Daktulosphaira vitifoliae TaxID=58002 RepID=UPI0021AA074C|nr:DNA polymerase eta-like [Daktulosphaira vitifoliae]
MDEFDTSRIIVLVDMDCFYCQVEVQHNQELIGKPVAVVQYNSWKGGGIIAVNYEARAKGVGRHMRGNDALKTCPDLNIVRVKELHGKADLSKYREASQKVFEVLSEFSPCVQRASIDEAYVDLTSAVINYLKSKKNKLLTELDLPNTYIEGYSTNGSNEDKIKCTKSWLRDVYNNELQDDNMLRLTVGAIMVENLRMSIFTKTGFRCSAGIANNKILAKLACGLNKPNKQTLLPPSSIPHLFKSVPLKKVRNLGGKLGYKVTQLFQCAYMSDLAEISLNDLRKIFDDKTSNFLYQIARGIDNEPVESRLIPKSIGSCKSFPLGLKVKEDVTHWLSTLIDDVFEKLNSDYKANKRKATSMTVSVKYQNREVNLPTSHCGEVISYCREKLMTTAFSLLCSMTDNQKQSINWKNPLTFIGLAVGKFKELKDEKYLINNYFNKATVTDTNNSNQTKSAEVNISILETSNNCIKQANTHTVKPLRSILNEHYVTHQPSCSKNYFPTCNSSVSNNTIKQSNITQNKLSIEFPKQKLKKEQLEDHKIETDQVNKLDVSSFFLKKLQSVSPTKVSNNDCLEHKFVDVNNKDNKLTLINTTYSENEIIVSNKSLDDKQSSDIGFFCKKIDIALQTKEEVKKSLFQIESSSIIEESNFGEDPLKLICDKCLRKLDIDEYDEHIDHHVAVELSKQLNSIKTVKIIENVSKTSSSVSNLHNSRKRKLGRPKSLSIKKPCKNSIPSYFKPSLNSS